VRLDIPRDDRRDVRRREEEVPPPPPISRVSEPIQIRVPASPLTRRVEKLQKRASENLAHHIMLPRQDRSIEPDRDPVDKRRQIEHRPRRTREGVALSIRGLRLRPEEQTLLAETGRFRVLAVKDIARTIYGGDERALQTDLRYLEERDLIRVNGVPARNDGRWVRPERIEVVTLTKYGKQLASETAKLPLDQRLYHGLVKPREVEHDTQIYRAYLKEAERIERGGGKNLRVELDFELKHKVQKGIYAARKAEPDRDLQEIRQEVAQRLDLPFIRNKIEIPDARIHYELDQGSRTAFSDIEVVTASYRPQHLRAKEQAGFRTYASPSDRAAMSARIEDEHHTLDWVLEL
jgi:hypothetical protein